MTRGAAMLGWLTAGHASAGALYLALINVSDANAAMLGLSAVLAGLCLFTLATVEGTIVAWLVPGTPFRAAVGRGVRAMPVFLAALAIMGACWILADQIEGRARAHAGEIDAWLIATFDMVPAAWVHRTLGAATFVVRGIVGISLGVAALGAGMAGGLRRLLSLAWVRAALSGQQLGLTAGAIVLLVVLPWRAVDWRPAWLPPTWIEVAFVALKLAALATVAHVGWLLVLFAGARGASRGAWSDRVGAA
jgi:hypothetical protein